MIYFVLLSKIEKKKIVVDQYENDCISLNDIAPNLYVLRKNNDVMLR